MSFNTSMTGEQIMEAFELHRRLDLHHAKQLRDHWQREVDRLEAMDPLRRLKTTADGQ